MKHFPRLVLILAILLSHPNLSRAAVVDKIKAVVNNEVITQSEIDRLLYPIYMRYKDIYESKELNERLEDASKEILNQLIEDRLMLSEARKRGIDASEKEIDQKIGELESKFTEGKTLVDTLHEQNLTIKDLRDRIRNQIMIEKILDSEIRRQIQIMPQEAESYYHSHIDRFKEPEQARVSAILIRLKSERTPEQSLTLAVNILQRLKEGEDFFTLAKNYSEGMNAEQGGDMGYVRKGQMIDKIDQAIFSLKIGEFSDLIETTLGYHIFKVCDRKKERTIPLTEARPNIMDDIYRKKMEERFKEWMEELKKNAFISIK